VSKTIETERVLEIKVQAPEADQKQDRLPLNLAIVLDRSGSMSGEKLNFVKEAGIHLLDLLEEQDHAAVVVYDNQVDVLSTSVPLTPANRKKLKAALKGVRSGGSTCLSGGWITGCNEVAKAIQDNSVNRVLLLTDGLANEGITDLEQLAKESRELAARGVSTSTFGVGRDFNEHLLEAMANQGGGIFHFIESPQDIPEIFQQEFKDLAAVTVRDVELTLDIPPQVKTLVLGNWQAKRENGHLRIFLGSMYSGRNQLLYVQLIVPASDTDGLTINGLARGKGEGGSLFEAQAEAAFKFVSKEDVEKAAPLADLLERYAGVAMADAATDALIMDRDRKRQEGLDHLGRTTRRHQQHLSHSQVQSYDDLHESMSHGMSEMDHKRTHFGLYNLKKMRIRGEDFLLHQPGGHIVIEADGKMILVDTGAPVSVGRPDHIRFLGKEFPLIPTFQNVVNMDLLSQKVGVHLDVLMGTDILRRCYFILDSQRQIATFSFNPLDWNVHHRIPLQNFLMGVPITRAMINGTPLDMFVDTGAVRCYIPKELVDGCPKVGKVTDFFPGGADFETPVFEVPFDLAGEKMNLECGVALPALLEHGLDAAGVRGILGMGLVRKYLVGFALPKDELILIEKF
jgi:Ca-activated chloride channel family protein